jgi:hypothetical protein
MRLRWPLPFGRTDVPTLGHGKGQHPSAYFYIDSLSGLIRHRNINLSYSGRRHRDLQPDQPTHRATYRIIKALDGRVLIGTYLIFTRLIHRNPNFDGIAHLPLALRGSGFIFAIRPMRSTQHIHPTSVPEHVRLRIYPLQCGPRATSESTNSLFCTSACG